MVRKALFLASAVCIGMLMSASARAAGKDTLVITGETDSNGFTPTLNGSPSEYFYATTVPAGAAFADTIPVQFDLSDTNNNPGEIVTVALTAVGQVAGSISFDTPPFNMTDPTSGMMHYVYINTSSLPPGDYHANVQVKATPASGVSTTHGTLHLLIHVADPAGQPTCYITDSSGLLLNDCHGSAVSTGGEFFIVTNQKKVTATNPGQFYFNYVWTNPGADVTFTSLGLFGTNVVPVGANSVHVLIYNGSSFTASFDDVNTDGTPCGKTGATCKSAITVPAGQTLWLTWHLAYSFIGAPAPTGLLNFASCGTPTANGTISMSAELKNGDGSVDLPCGPATANGYTLK
jgi:hypothetical protein